MIRPSTTKKITAAMRNTMVYSSRMRSPWDVTAIGGYRLRTICSPAFARLKPLMAAMATPATRTTPMARATIAALEVRPVRGELAIQILERGHGATDGARCRDECRAEPTHGRPGRNAAMIPGACARCAPAHGTDRVSAPPSRVRGTMPRMRPRSITRFALAGLGSGLAWLVSAGVVAAHGPVPDEPPTLANLLLGWTFEPLPTLGLLVT